MIAQGTESGGHTGQMGVLALLEAVLRRCPDIPVLAAGGVGDARSLAAVMAAGADGACMGTAFSGFGGPRSVAAVVGKFMSRQRGGHRQSVRSLPT